MKEPLINNVGLIVELRTQPSYYCLQYGRGRGGAKAHSSINLTMPGIVNLYSKEALIKSAVRGDSLGSAQESFVEP